MYMYQVGHYTHKTDGRISYHTLLYLQLRMIFGPLSLSSWTLMYFDHAVHVHHDHLIVKDINFPRTVQRTLSNITHQIVFDEIIGKTERRTCSLLQCLQLCLRKTK